MSNSLGRFMVLSLTLLLVSCVAAQDARRDANVHYMLGGSYLQQGDVTGALKEFLRAAEADPKNVDIQAALGQAYHLKRAYKDAEKHYLEALRLSQGDNPQVQNNLGALYLDLQQWDKALEYFRPAAENLLFERPEIPQTGIAVAQLHKSNYLDSIEACKLAIRANPGYVQAYYYLGQAYDGLEKTDAAIKAYQEAVKRAPAFSSAHYRLGMSYMRLQQADKARAEFKEVIRLAPDSEEGQLALDYLEVLKK